MMDVAESSEDPWAAASAPADPFVAAPPGSPTIPVSPSRPTDQDPWGTPAASSDPWIETPTSPSAPADPFAAPPADPFEAATGSSPTAPSPALPARTEGSPSVSVPPDNTPADPWSQQPPAPAAEAPGGTPATGARKLRKKLAALTGMHHAGERASKAASKAKEKAKEKLAKKKSTEPPPAGVWIPATWSDGIFHAVCDLYYPTEAAMQQWTFERSTQLAKNPLYRGLLKAVGPTRMFRMGPRMNRLFQRGTTLANEIRDRSAVSRMTFPPGLHDRVNLSSNVPALRAMAVITGGKGVKARMLEYSETHALYECTWV